MLVWTPGKESKVHDHAASHCLMKIMKGELKETRWVTPEGGARTPEEMDVEGVREYKRGKVAYMCDDVSRYLSFSFVHLLLLLLYRSIACWTMRQESRG